MSNHFLGPVGCLDPNRPCVPWRWALAGSTPCDCPSAVAPSAAIRSCWAWLRPSLLGLQRHFRRYCAAMDYRYASCSMDSAIQAAASRSKPAQDLCLLHGFTSTLSTPKNPFQNTGKFAPDIATRPMIRDSTWAGFSRWKISSDHDAELCAIGTVGRNGRHRLAHQGYAWQLRVSPVRQLCPTRIFARPWIVRVASKVSTSELASSSKLLR